MDKNEKAEVTLEVSTPAETPAVETEESATEFLQKGVAEIEAKSTEEVVETPEAEEAEETPETEEEPSVAEEEAEKFDEAELLKAVGLTQKSLADVKDDLNKARSQAELFNFLSGNVEGFGDFLTQQIMIARGAKPEGKLLSLDNIGKREPELPKANNEKLLENYTEDQIKDFKELLTELAPALGFVKHTDLEADKKQAKQEQAEEKAVSTFNDFGKSEPVKEQLKAMKLDWEADVKPAVVNKLLKGYGIRDYAHITQENIIEAYNSIIIGRKGGIEKLLSNVKSEAAKTHEEKLKLGQMVPKVGQPAIKPEFDVNKLLNDPNVTSKDIKERMKALVNKRR